MILRTLFKCGSLHVQLYDIENFIQVATCSLSLFPSIVAIISLAKRIQIWAYTNASFTCIFLLYVHTHACNNLYNIIIADPITKFQKQREPSFQIFEKKNQNQRTANSYHFKTLAEPTALGESTRKEPTIIFILFFMKIRVLNQKTGSSPKNKKTIREKLRNLKNCHDNRWGFDGAISNTRPPWDQLFMALF
jgi:hypothetical protein